MTAQTALSWFLRSYRALGGDIAEMVDAMALFILDAQAELKKRHAQEARR